MERKEKQERKGKDLSKKYKDLRYNFHIFLFYEVGHCHYPIS